MLSGCACDRTFDLQTGYLFAGTFKRPNHGQYLLLTVFNTINLGMD
ncbi:hypothetical protein AM1_0012 [Acaryochloris marina MBIC11017]|uniref:Uncharacterized protein n=1 Tax=Acaryochloris marina (strain MBIC 11017) TaxID=329726 RepID=B0C4Y9_ACAM1|nr:hypothetical protein AM1_0012 [Acaryochloris marina MBIC11017]